jgi:hypothetical protein
MAESTNYENSSQTLVVDADNFNFETLDHKNGCATLIKFKLNQPTIRPGDILAVLSGTDVHFHGRIEAIEEDGWAIASDPRDSLLPATIQ